MKPPNYLKEKSYDIEFWVDPETDSVMCMYKGTVTTFDDASVEVGTALMAHIIDENHFDKLYNEGLLEPIEMMKEYIRRYFANFDGNSDLSPDGFRYEYTGHKLGLNPANLTNREIEYIKLSALDLPDKIIADRMNVAEFTAKKHRQNAEGKTGCYSKAGLISWAYKEGVL